MPSTFTDVLIAGGVPNQWIKVVNNSSGTGYVSTAVTTFASASTGGGLYTFNPGPPAGIYTSYTLSGTLSATQPVVGDGRWVATGNTNYVISYTAGDNAALQSLTTLVSGPYGPPAGIPAGAGEGGIIYCGPASGVDDTALINNAISAAAALGPGGAVCLWDWNHDYVCLGALTVPFTGPAGAPVQNPVRLFGPGSVVWNGYWNVPPAARPVLDLRYNGGSSQVAKIDTRGAGTLEIDHLNLKSGGTDNYPFFQTTNTTVFLHDMAVIGNQANSGTSCLQDAFVMGSTTNTIGNSATAPFQGYGSKIRDVFFSNIRKCIVFQTFCNSIEVENITVSKTCGSGDTQGAPLHFSPLAGSGNGCFGNRIKGGTFELTNYPYCANLVNDCYSNIFDGMGCFDLSGTSLGIIYCGASGVNSNVCLSGQVPAAYATKIFQGPNGLLNLLLGQQSGTSSVFPGEVLIGPGALTSAIPGDLTVSRGGASPGTAQISFGSAAAGTHAVYWDGTRFVFSDPLRTNNSLDHIASGNALYIGPTNANLVVLGNPTAPIRIDGHVVSNASGTPSTTNLGANITSVTFTGNDVRGKIVIIVAAGGLAANTRIATCTYATAFASTPGLVMLTNETLGVGLAVVVFYPSAEAAGTFDLFCDQALVAGTYTIKYLVMG